MTSEVRTILNQKHGISSAKVSAQMIELKKSSKLISGGDKYLGRTDLESDGLSRQYDDIKKKLIEISGYDSSSSLVYHKLNLQENRMRDIKTVMVDFMSQSTNTSSNIKTKEEICNEALDQIARILRTQHNGEYVFGGMNTTSDPLKTDIVTTSNYIDGKVTKNYTDSTPNKNAIILSEQHKVKTDLVYAGMEGVSHFIATIHEFKKAESKHALEKIQTLYEIGSKAHDNDSMNVSRSIAQVKEAEAFRVQEEANSQNILNEDYTADILEEAQAFKEYLTSVHATTAMFKKLTSIMDMLIS